MSRLRHITSRRPRSSLPWSTREMVKSGHSVQATRTPRTALNVREQCSGTPRHVATLCATLGTSLTTLVPSQAPFRYVQSAPPSEYSLHASAPREEHAYAAPFYTQSVSRPAIAAQQQQIPTQPVPSAWTPPQPPLTSMPSTESASKEAQGVPHTRSKSPPSPSDIISQASRVYRPASLLTRDLY